MEDSPTPELKNNRRKSPSKPRGKNGGKRPGAGRKKGVPNKLTKDVRAAIMAAFDEVGGVTYLKTVAKADPRTFCTLLGKILPTQIAGDPTAPVKIEFSWLTPSGL